MGFYRKRPVVIEAVRWSGQSEDIGPILEWVQASGVADGYVGGPGVGYVPPLGTLDIPTLEGTMTAQPGDWIIKGVKGEVYPCKPGIFEATYEPADPAHIDGDAGVLDPEGRYLRGLE